MRITALLLAAILAGCAPPHPVAPPDTGPGTCTTAEMNLRELGGCGVDLTTFAVDCAAEHQAEAEIGVRLPVACLTNSKTCEESRRCE